MFGWFKKKAAQKKSDAVGKRQKELYAGYSDPNARSSLASRGGGD